MKKWNTPVIAELNISETANGRNNWINESKYTNENADGFCDAVEGAFGALVDQVTDIMNPNGTPDATS